MFRIFIIGFSAWIFFASGAAAATKDCPAPNISAEVKMGDRWQECYRECQKIVADLRQLEKEWDHAFAAARSDLLKAKAIKDHDASWGALKRIYLSMNLREPDLSKLLSRVAALKLLAEKHAKFEPLPKFESPDVSPDNPIVKAVVEATDKIDVEHKKEADAIGVIARYLKLLEAEIREKKGIWVEKISHPASP